MSAVSDASLVLQKQIGSGPDLAQKGVWDVGTAYVVGDVTTRLGNTYFCTSPNTAIDPSTDGGAHWTIVRTGITSAAMLTLSDALITGFSAMTATRQSRRVGLLNAVCVPAALPVGVSVGDISKSWAENQEAAAYLAAAQANDQNLGAFRVNDLAVRSSLTSGYTQAQLTAMANLLIDSASDFAELTAASLPA